MEIKFNSKFSNVFFIKDKVVYFKRLLICVIKLMNSLKFIFCYKSVFVYMIVICIIYICVLNFIFFD